jgi:hypothetical protein
MIQKVCKTSEMRVTGLTKFGELGHGEWPGSADLRAATSTDVAAGARSGGS